MTPCPARVQELTSTTDPARPTSADAAVARVDADTARIVYCDVRSGVPATATLDDFAFGIALTASSSTDEHN